MKGLCQACGTLLLAGAVLLGIGCILPWRDRFADEAAWLQQYRELREADPSLFPVVSYNIRLDGEEANIDNHFTRRVYRLAKFFHTTAPLLAGLQEPYGGQLLHLQSELPARYRVLGYEQPLDRANMLRASDYQTAIVYDSEVLECVASDHYWLSETPRIQHSKSWGSVGARTVTIGAFRFNERQASRSNTSADVIMLNTHLDVWSAKARSHQAGLLLAAASEWQAKYPTAAIVVTGDFNAANGHEPHRILLSNGTLHDAWDTCVSNGTCIADHMSATFHGWLGASIMDCWVARLAHYAVMIVHGAGLDLPRDTRGLSVNRVLKLASSVIGQLSPTTLVENAPASLWRMHVDWLLTNDAVTPKLIFVGEARNSAFSSDHFPIVSLLKLK